jgi:hypothetical protein
VRQRIGFHVNKQLTYRPTPFTLAEPYTTTSGDTPVMQQILLELSYREGIEYIVVDRDPQNPNAQLIEVIYKDTVLSEPNVIADFKAACRWMDMEITERRKEA